MRGHTDAGISDRRPVLFQDDSRQWLGGVVEESDDCDG